MLARAPFQADDADWPSLRKAVSDIAGAGYSEAAVTKRLGLQDISALQWRAAPIYRDECLAAREELDLAIDLFLLQGGLTAMEWERLLPAAGRGALVKAGLVGIDEAGLARARASLFPVGEKLIFSDCAWPELPYPGFVTPPHDHVMAIGLDSRHLARTALRRPVRAALDLCTGSGIHALLAAPCAQQVVAADINPRAVACARFNAQVHSAGNMEAVESDLFGAVGHRQFDLITANPPFVPSPLSTLGFRDGGASGEDVQKRIVAGLPLYLAPGGTAQMVTELGERDGEPLFVRLREWLAGAPMDIHILRLAAHSAAQYAVGHAKGDDYATFLSSTGEWAANLRAHRYARVVSAVISFQWSDAKCGAPWERMDEARAPQRPAGAEIEAIFAAERLARNVNLGAYLEGKRLRRADPIALFDAAVTGSVIPPKARATRLGQSLAIEYELEPLERQALALMDAPVATDAIKPETLRSLLRKRLVGIEDRKR